MGQRRKEDNVERQNANPELLLLSAFIPVESQPSSSLSRFRRSLPNIFSVLQFSLDNSAYERCFCGSVAIFLWKHCARFQIAVFFFAHSANALT
jgi:hypothetical protein